MPRRKPTKIQVDARALLYRVNRALADEGTVVKKCSPRSRWYSDLGDYYAVENHAVTAKHIDIQQWAREMGVLKAHEELADE